MLQSECSNRILLLEGTARKNSVTIKEMTRAEENHMIRTNEIVTLYHGSKSGIRGILDEQKLTEDDRKKLKQESEANRSKGIAMADEICRKYRRDGMFFDEILKAGE